MTAISSVSQSLACSCFTIVLLLAISAASIPDQNLLSDTGCETLTEVSESSHWEVWGGYVACSTSSASGVQGSYRAECDDQYGCQVYHWIDLEPFAQFIDDGVLAARVGAWIGGSSQYGSGDEGPGSYWGSGSQEQSWGSGSQEQYLKKRVLPSDGSNEYERHVSDWSNLDEVRRKLDYSSGGSSYGGSSFGSSSGYPAALRKKMIAKSAARKMMLSNCDCQDGGSSSYWNEAGR